MFTNVINENEAVINGDACDMDRSWMMLGQGVYYQGAHVIFEIKKQ